MDKNVKENDWLLNSLYNPAFTNSDFKAVGINANNTSLLDKETYKNSETIRNNPLLQTDGKFDEAKFNIVYNNVLESYNKLSSDTYNEDVMANATFFRDNIFAPVEKREQGPQIEVTKVTNPYRQTKGIIDIDRWGPRTKTEMELAESEKVLANPEAVAKGATPIWQEAPEESFFDNFWETRVLAQWEFDADKDGNPTNDSSKIVYHKGELKLNDNGAFYFENLGNRSVYGRRVLSKANILTKEDSWANKFDFFDSDDIDKSWIGTAIKNIVSIVPMFIPYVGPVYVGTGVVMELASLGTTLGKMAAGSDTPSLSKIEGFIQSINQPNTSEYATNNTWSLENLINMAGDAFKFIYTQRWVFKNSPALFKGRLGIKNEEEQAEQLSRWTKEFTEKGLKRINNLSFASDAERAQAIANNTIAAQSKAQTMLENYINNYNKLGAEISRAYMATTIGADMYGEAKAQGLSDNEAAVVTLGYMAGEWAILKSDIGSWIFPELKVPAQERKAMIRTLLKREGIEEESKSLLTNNKAEKVKWFNRLFNKGKNILNEVYSANKSAWSAASSTAFAEGIEEVTEELLRDLTTSTYNLYNWMSGSTSPKMSSFDNVADRYLMSFVGGALGGAMYSSVDSFKYSKKIANMDYNTAIQKLVYMGRNGMLDKFLREANKMTLGDKNLSSTPIFMADGTKVYSHGTDTDNQNLANHQALRRQVEIIQNVLDANGASVTDQRLMDIQTLKDVRFAILKNSQTIGSALQDFNTTMSNIFRLTSELNSLNSTESKMERGETDRKERAEGESDIVKKSRAELEAALKEEIAKKDAFLNGELAPEYIGRSIFEMSFALNEAFIDGYFRNWAETKTGKSYIEIPENDLNKLKKEYKEYCDSARKDAIKESYELFKKTSKEVSSLLQNSINVFMTMSNEEKIFQSLGENRMNKLLESESAEQFQSDADTWATSKLRIYNELVDAFGSDVEKQKLINIAQSGEDSSIIANQMSDYLINFARTKLPNILTPIVKQGFINPEVKNRIINTLDEVINGIYIDANNSQNPDIEEEYLNMAENLEGLRIQIKDLSNTPIIQSLNSFGTSLTGGEVNIGQLLDILNKQLNNSLKDIGEFTTNSDNVKMLDTAIQIISMFKSGVLASEKAPAKINNIYGYNTTMNELVKDSNLAEIDSDLAATIYQDLDTLLSKFKFFKKLIESNANQKLKEQNRVSVNKDFIFYKRTIRLLDNLPSDWEGVEELKSEIGKLNKLRDLSDAGSLNLSLEERIELEIDTLKMKDAIYNFFSKNKSKVDNVDELSKLISAKNFDIYTDNNDVLSAVSTSIDDNSYIWQLATWASVKATDFYNLYKGSITETVAPIATQELAIYTGYASIKNGNVFDKFVDAYKKSLINDYDIYVTKARERGSSPVPKEFILESSFAPRYPRVTLIEGIPGSGKTNGVYKSIVNLLKKDGNFDLKNIWVVNTNKDTATKLSSELNFSESSKVTPMDKRLLMSTISPEWSETKNAKGDVEVSKDMIRMTDEGEIESIFKIQSISDIPSVIFIDETSHYSCLDMDLINRFAIKYGITVLAAGDFDQSGLVGKIPNFYEGRDFNLSLGRFQFIRTPKLGVSMRTANGQQSANIALIRSVLNDITKSNFSGNIDLPLRYYIDQETKNLYGTLVLHNSKLTSRIKDTIKNMVDTLKEGEKIGYVYTDSTSELYKLLTTEFSDHIQLYKGSSAQGLEGQYFIIENRDSTNPDSSLYASPEEHYKNIYTGISRASQGCMLILGTDYNDGGVQIRNASPDTYPIEEVFNPTLIKKFSDEKRQILDKIVQSGELIKYIPRTSQVRIENVPETTERKSDETVETIVTTENGESQAITIIDQGVTIQGEQEEKIDNSNDDSESLPRMELEATPVEIKEIKPKGGEVSPVVQNGRLESSEQLTLPIYTEQNHELGAIINSDGTISKSVAAESRIDGINGLVKLDIFKEKPFESLGKEAQDILEMIKSMAYYESDKGKLTQRIKNYLGINGDTYVTFAFKSISRNQSFLRGTANYLKFGKDVEKESQYDNHGSGNRSLEGRYKFIEMIVGTKQQGDLLEVSLATLPNWMSIINSSIISDEIKNIYARLDSTIAVGKKDHDYQVSKALQQELRTRRDLPGAEVLDKLIEVYNFTNNAVFYLGDADWTLAKNFTTTGPILTRGLRGNQYKVGGFEYKGDWITLDQFVNESTKSVSDVYVSSSGIYTSADGVNHEIKKGYPFVLVSDRGIAKNNLASEYMRQLENPTIPKRVKLYYIIPPRATVREYFDNIRLIKEKKTHDNIGNLLTNYRILENIIDNEAVVDRANAIGHKDTLSTMTKLIESLKDVDEKYEPGSKSNIVEKLKILNNPIEGETVTVKKDEAISANTVIQNFLFDLVFAENNTIRTSDINYNSEEKTSEILSIIENTLAEHRIIGINYHVPLSKDESNPFMIKANTVDGIHLKTLSGNKSFEVNGKLDTTELVGNITPILDMIIGKMNFDIDGMGRSLDTVSYVRGNSSLESFNVESKPSIKDNIISNKQVSSIIDNFISKNPDTTIEGLTRHLMSQGHITIQNEKDTIVYGKDSRIEDNPIIKIEKVGEIVGNIQPILVILENGTKYEGNLYLEASPNNSKYQLEVTRQTVDTSRKLQQADLIISEDSEIDYIDLFTQINEDAGPEGSDFLSGVVYPNDSEPISDTIKTALEENGLVPLENGVYKSVDPDIKEMFDDAYEQMNLIVSSGDLTNEVINAYKNVMEYIKNVYDNAENGEIMDNDCPVKITLNI